MKTLDTRADHDKTPFLAEQALSLLLAEMQALTQVMPGLVRLTSHQKSDDALIEAAFDNMPV